MSIREQACAEVAKYRIEPQIDSDDKPLHWWKGHKSIYLTVLNWPGKLSTSLPSESPFSICVNVISQKRASLTPQYTDV